MTDCGIHMGVRSGPGEFVASSHEDDRVRHARNSSRIAKTRFAAGMINRRLVLSNRPPTVLRKKSAERCSLRRVIPAIGKNTIKAIRKPLNSMGQFTGRSKLVVGYLDKLSHSIRKNATAMRLSPRAIPLYHSSGGFGPNSTKGPF